ncbi:MAG: efflux RND transporter periplasmic adaptor subunit [Chitinophagales bacterium]
MSIIFLSISKKYILTGFAIALLAFAGCKPKTGNTDVAVADSVKETYTCPMHPQIMESHPGNCPVCGMALVKRENAKREISQVDLSTLLQPTNRVVLSSIPVISLQHAVQQKEIDAFGRIEYDTRFIKTIAARISGRIERLYVRYRYQHVHAGDKIMDIYSPELLTGQENLLFILKNDPANISLINAAKERLLLLGMSSGQLRQVIAQSKPLFTVSLYSNCTGHVHESGNMNNASGQMNMPGMTEELSLKEGMYVQKGQPVFQIYNMTNSWVTLSLFAGDNTLVTAGTPVTIIPETAPDKKFVSKISFIEPFYRSNSKTLTARVYFNNISMDLPVGSQVKAIIPVRTKMESWLPQQAVLSLGLNKVVMLKNGDVFEVHPVHTGIVANDLIQIRDGLNDQDSVAADAQFLIDSESFIKVNQ